MSRSLRSVTVLLVTLAALLPRGASAATRYIDEVFDAVTVETDIVYGHAVNDKGVDEILKLDIYEPAGDTAAARPLFVWAHGGSGVYGDKGEGTERDFATSFAKRGWVVASINYRLMSLFLGGSHDFLDAIGPNSYSNLRSASNDMQAAIRWFRANAAARRIDPDAIAAAGHSYGGGMAAYVNFDPEYTGDNASNPGYASNVKATFIHASFILEPSSINAGDPPVLMAHALDDSDLTYFGGTATTCTPTRAVGNECVQLVFTDGGHGMGKHRRQVMENAAAFLCARVVPGCDAAE
jgi:dienelactone hydrolase